MNYISESRVENSFAFSKNDSTWFSTESTRFSAKEARSIVCWYITFGSEKRVRKSFDFSDVRRQLLGCAFAPR
jgi:hypothetical protein